MATGFSGSQTDSPRRGRGIEPLEQDASRGTPAGAPGLLHLQPPRRPQCLQTVTQAEGGQRDSPT